MRHSTIGRLRLGLHPLSKGLGRGETVIYCAVDNNMPLEGFLRGCCGWGMISRLSTCSEKLFTNDKTQQRTKNNNKQGVNPLQRWAGGGATRVGVVVVWVFEGWGLWFVEQTLERASERAGQESTYSAWAC